MGGVPLRERQRQVREDAILDMAHELMVAEGYSDMSMDDLAARVGISKATLYQHFGSKEELAISVIVRAMRRGEDYITSLDPGLPAIRRLELVMRNMIAKRTNIGSGRMMLPPMTIIQHPDFQAQSGRMTELVGELVDAAKREGDIPSDLVTPVIVRLLLSSMREHGFLDLLVSEQCSLGQLTDTVIAVLFDGLRTHRHPAAQSEPTP
jgi:TetR/AcrR family transcriptional regulator, regulator of autoinduction and epiphytic fitness